MRRAGLSASAERLVINILTHMDITLLTVYRSVLHCGIESKRMHIASYFFRPAVGPRVLLNPTEITIFQG